MHLYLTGFMGVGKTTLGKKLARVLKMPFIDTDQVIVDETGKSVQELMKENGEDGFRKTEADVLRSLNGKSPSVVATGGGLPCYYDNIAFMNEHGFTVYLRAENSFIYSRLSALKSPRPLIQGLNKDELRLFIADKMMQRTPYYMQSKLVVDVPAGSLETLINTICDAYRHVRDNERK